MKSFGRLLRKLRGIMPLAQLSERTGFSADDLESLEAGRQIASEFVAGHILRKGFDLDRRDITRVILGVHLYDLGLRDNDIRQLVIDLITRTVSDKIREKVRAIYRSYQA